MTGTDLDGVPIEKRFHSLSNYSTIRAGSTYFTFIAVKPPGDCRIFSRIRVSTEFAENLLGEKCDG